METKKLKFGFNTTNLTAINTSYERSRELVLRTFEVARLFDTVNLIQGVKSGDLVPLLDFNPSFVAGVSGYSNDNNITANNVAITTKGLKSDVTISLNDLVGTAFERYLPAGAVMEDMTEMEKLEQFMVSKYAIAIQNLALKGADGANSIDGLITKAYASGSGAVEVTGTAPTSTDALTKLFAIYSAMPATVLSADKKPVILVGNDWLRMAAMQAFNDNRLAFNFQIDQNNGFTLPTTSVRIQGFDALNTTNKALAGTSNHMVVGTDSNDDLSGLKIWYSEDNLEIRSTIRFRLGTALAFAEDMVIYKIA